MGIQYPSLYDLIKKFNPNLEDVCFLENVTFYNSTTRLVSLLVGKQVLEGTCSQVLRSTSVDSKRFESI